MSSLLNCLTVLCLGLGVASSLGQTCSAQQALFNGTDLSGWYAIKTQNPREFKKLPPEEQQKLISDAKANTAKFWKVENGILVNDGTGPFLTSEKEFRDFDLKLEFKIAPGTDSGVYLKASPQVQIWDFTHEPSFKHGAEKGSGGLWNNKAHPDARMPLVLADNPVGQWNKLHVTQTGARTTIVLNEKKIVEHQIMDNYWNRERPLIASGPIQLQTHGGRMEWRNIIAEELTADASNTILAAANRDGFEKVFNGTDFTGWKGPIDNYEIADGILKCKPGKGGTIYTESEYADFVARFEFRLPPGGNNGLAIRYPGRGDTAYVGMCELQVLDNTAEKYKSLDSRQYHGSAYGMAAAEQSYLRPVGQWNFQEVTVVGSTIKVELNGNVILDTDLSEIKDYLGDYPHPGKDRTLGHFGFAGHSDPVEFRNVFIKKL